MKKEQILNNLTEAYNVLVNELSEDQMTELGYEGVNATTFCQNVLSRADNISYEESEKVYNEGIDFIIAKQLGVGSNIVSELLAHAAALLMSYGLTDEEYEEWQGKQRNVYSSLLHAVVGDVSEINIREMVAQASENACVRKMIKNIDLSARNGVCITDVGGEKQQLEGLLSCFHSR